MGLRYEHLDSETRRYMLLELEDDAKNQGVYFSERLNPKGTAGWVDLLRAAFRDRDDVWLSAQIHNQSYLKPNDMRLGRPIKMAINAHEMLAEGEFNRYYIRALCRIAQDVPGFNLQIYRAKDVEEPRPESQARIGTSVTPEVTLGELRTPHRIEMALGVPGGPNSGLSIRLVRRG